MQSFTRRKFSVRPIEKERKESPENKKGVYQDRMNSLSQMDKQQTPRKEGFVLCSHLGSNQGPKDYESSTLTN